VCRQQTLLRIDARAPRAFFTDLRPRDFDGAFEYTPRATRPRLSLDPSPGKESKPEDVGNCRVRSFRGEVAAINDNDGEGGFEFRAVKIDGQEGGACAVIEEDDQGDNRIRPVGSKYRLALLARRVTDVLLAEMIRWPEGVRPIGCPSRFWQRAVARGMLGLANTLPKLALLPQHPCWPHLPPKSGGAPEGPSTRLSGSPDILLRCLRTCRSGDTWTATARLVRIKGASWAMRLRSSIMHTTRSLLVVVAAAALAVGTLAQSPAHPPAELPPPASAPAAEPTPGAPTEDCLAAPAGGCPCLPAPPPFGGPLLERPKLTGDWLGLRGTLRDCGITVDVSTTQFYQGVASGGLERSFPYGGRNDYFLNVDFEKLGLWKGFFLNLHGETRYGESANFDTGALSPVNEYLLVPGSEGVVSGLTAVKFTQFLSENTLVFAGKINLLDEIKQPLTNATGLNGFLNTSLIFNTILARTLPYSAFGAGFIYLQDEHPVFTLSVFDTNDASKTSVFDSFFENGVVILGTALLPTRFFGLPGHQGVEGVYSSGKYTNFQDSPYLDPVLNGSPLLQSISVCACRPTGTPARRPEECVLCCRLSKSRAFVTKSCSKRMAISSSVGITSRFGSSTST
jgi:hypothetical protein